MEEKETILCVDDEEPILKCLKRVLEAEGYNVLTAAGGEAGLKLLSGNKVDLVITDQRMPVMDGSSFLRLVRKNSPGVVSIMLSGHSDFDALVRALNEGEVFRFLTKPWDNDELKAVIKNALEHKRVVGIANCMVDEAKKILKMAGGVSVDISHDPNCVVLRIGEEGAIFSEQAIFQFLEFIFKSLGLHKQNEIKALSGCITKQKGLIIMTIDMGKGMSLKVEVPSGDAEK